MSSALPGVPLCKEHHNRSHYAKENCLICLLRDLLIAELRYNGILYEGLKTAEHLRGTNRYARWEPVIHALAKTEAYNAKST